MARDGGADRGIARGDRRRAGASRGGDRRRVGAVAVVGYRADLLGAKARSERHAVGSGDRVAVGVGERRRRGAGRDAVGRDRGRREGEGHVCRDGGRFGCRRWSWFGRGRSFRRRSWRGGRRPHRVVPPAARSRGGDPAGDGDIQMPLRSVVTRVPLRCAVGLARGLNARRGDDLGVRAGRGRADREREHKNEGHRQRYGVEGGEASTGRGGCCEVRRHANLFVGPRWPSERFAASWTYVRTAESYLRGTPKDRPRKTRTGADRTTDQAITISTGFL